MLPTDLPRSEHATQAGSDGSAKRASQEGKRLAWLDGLRGIAALVVAFHHSSYQFMPVFRRAMLEWFDAGTYGVMVFFLVSGYIIPASLERRGSIRGFWISRLFRMYPLWAVAGAVTLLLALGGVKPLRGEFTRQSAISAVVGHGSLLQDLLTTPNVINVLWTLSYEMAFYLLVAGLFAVGMHRMSAQISTGAALISVALGGILPTALLSRALGIDATVLLTTVVLVASIGCAMSGRAVLRTVGAVAGALLAIVLVAVNGRVGPWEGILILAVMFLGTLIYRAEHGQVSRRTAAVVTAVVLGCALLSGVWHGTDQRGWTTAIVGAALTFGAAFALRHKHVPSWAALLGVISYSVYLLHPVLLMVTDGTIGRWQQDNIPVEAAFLAVLLPLCYLTQRYVEAPAQRLGRRLARKVS